MIVKNQLQCFFLNMYDKTRHAFPSHQRNGYNRAEEIFHKFINCIHTHYLDQKDVSFYANELCISPRYLSTIARQVTGESAKTIIDRHIILETKDATYRNPSCGKIAMEVLSLQSRGSLFRLPLIERISN